MSQSWNTETLSPGLNKGLKFSRFSRSLSFNHERSVLLDYSGKLTPAHV